MLLVFLEDLVLGSCLFRNWYGLVLSINGLVPLLSSESVLWYAVNRRSSSSLSSFIKESSRSYSLRCSWLEAHMWLPPELSRLVFILESQMKSYLINLFKCFINRKSTLLPSFHIGTLKKLKFKIWNPNFTVITVSK